MRNETVAHRYDSFKMPKNEWGELENPLHTGIVHQCNPLQTVPESKERTEILVLTSYPPRECGIATYSQDLIKSLNNKFGNSISISVCALESGKANYAYPHEVKYVLNTSNAREYQKLASTINKEKHIKIVLIQHEFGFYKDQENAFLRFLVELSVPAVLVFHTVLPHPDSILKSKIGRIADLCESIIVMTHNSAGILANDYGLSPEKISVIPHGTHLVLHLNRDFLKRKHGLKDRKVLTTFGLLSSGKSIETTLEALPAIVRKCPEVVFLIIGKTHPEVKITEGEGYREMLEQWVGYHKLQDHVIFLNRYLALPDLLEFLQLTDIYLFTTNDPNQAVSGTFSYAMSCACPIISTPIPHAREALTDDTGIIFDFRNAAQLSEGVIKLLNDETLRRNISSNTLQKIVSTAWENSAVSHIMLFKRIFPEKTVVNYNLPDINLSHLRKMTTHRGIIQFSKINQPDLTSGFTLDDNARALIAMCMHFKLTKEEHDLKAIYLYLGFIKRCLQSSGSFLNYMDKDDKFTIQNYSTNLDDANGRAVWALGYVISLMGVLPYDIISEALQMIRKPLLHMQKVHSPRAMAFTLKGLYYYQNSLHSQDHLALVKTLADRLVQMYRHESDEVWQWFEGYLTYANSILPESMMYAWLSTGDVVYKEIALSSLKFLLSQTFHNDEINVICNKRWLKRGQKGVPQPPGGEQPIDVAYTIMTLSIFYDVFKDPDYYLRATAAFNWFLGSNRLHQTVYNPCTGGCYDGLEENHVNLNQGAESTLSYLLARLTIQHANDSYHSGNLNIKPYSDYSTECIVPANV